MDDYKAKRSLKVAKTITRKHYANPLSGFKTAGDIRRANDAQRVYLPNLLTNEQSDRLMKSKYEKYVRIQKERKQKVKAYSTYLEIKLHEPKWADKAVGAKNVLKEKRRQDRFASALTRETKLKKSGINSLDKKMGLRFG
jgi:hypothetical protein